MRYYFFDRYYGHDRVAQAASLPKVKAGDFFECRGVGYGLCLGETISRSEQYTKYEEKDLDASECIHYGSLFGADSLQLLHRFAQHWFCSYKKAIPLRVGHIEELAKRKKKLKKSKDQTGQHLHIFPNTWSLMNAVSQDLITNPSTAVLTSQHTKKQKSESFRKIQSGEIKNLYCTYSQMFQDRKFLESIHLYDQHQRYYKNQKDPRYHALTVVKKIGELHDIPVILTGYPRHPEFLSVVDEGNTKNV